MISSRYATLHVQVKSTAPKIALAARRAGVQYLHRQLKHDSNKLYFSKSKMVVVRLQNEMIFQFPNCNLFANFRALKWRLDTISSKSVIIIKLLLLILGAKEKHILVIHFYIFNFHSTAKHMRYHEMRIYFFFKSNFLALSDFWHMKPKKGNIVHYY